MTLKERLPKSWNEITLLAYQELQEIREKEWESDIQLKIEELALLLDMSPDDPELESLSVDELYSLVKEISWTNRKPPSNLKHEIELNGMRLHLLDMTQLKLGEYIDVEHFLKDGEKNLHMIAAILYKQSKQNEWGHVIFEPYKYNVYERAKIFQWAPCTQIFAVLEYFINWRNDITKAYSNIFEDPNWDQVEDADKLDPEELEEIQREIKQEKKKAVHTWEAILWELSNHNISNFESIFDTQVILVFNVLSMKKSLKV